MRTIRLGDPETMAYSAMVNAVEDRLALAVSGQSAVVRAPAYAGGTPIPPTDPRFSYSGTWASGVTTTPGSSVSFAYTGVAATILFTPTTGSGIAFVTLDGAPRLAVDVYSSNAVLLNGIANGGLVFNVVSPDMATLLSAPGGGQVFDVIPGAVHAEVRSPGGGQHVVTMTYYGDINTAVQPVSPLTNTVGTTVGKNLSLSRLVRGSTVDATHTIRAIDATHVSVDGAGSYAAGTTTTTAIPGVSLVVGTLAMVAGDTATVVVVGTGITVQGALVSTAVQPAGTWTSPVVDSVGQVVGSDPPWTVPLVDPAAMRSTVRWVLFGWEEDPAAPVRSGAALVGNTTSPADPSWSSTTARDGFGDDTLCIAHAVTAEGMGLGFMGMAVLPDALYAQVSLDLGGSTFFRNPRLYCWDPGTDPDRPRFPPAPDELETDNDLGIRLYAALMAAKAMNTRDPFREMNVSKAISSSVGPYLDLHGQEFRLPRLYGMSDTTYRTVLQFLSAARFVGPTHDFLTRALALILGPDARFSIAAQVTSTSQWTLGASRLGIDTTLGPSTVGRLTAIVTVQTDALSVPPQIVQQFMELFRPFGVAVIYIFD